MSIPALKWCNRITTGNADAKNLLRTLCDMAQPRTNAVSVKQATLMARTELPERNLRRATRWLERQGLIAARRMQWATEYVLSMPASRAAETPAEAEPVAAEERPTRPIEATTDRPNGPPDRPDGPINGHPQPANLAPHTGHDGPPDRPGWPVSYRDSISTQRDSKREAAKPPRAQPMPVDFFPDEKGRRAAEAKGLDVLELFDRFRDWCAAKAARSADWQAQWRLWVAREGTFGRRPGPVQADGGKLGWMLDPAYGLAVTQPWAT